MNYFVKTQPFDKRAYQLDPKTYLNRLNRFLTAAGILFHKNLKTHSFRIGLVTRITAVAGLETAKEFVGHESVATTYRYNRNKLRVSYQKHIINESFKALEKN